MSKIEQIGVCVKCDEPIYAMGGTILEHKGCNPDILLVKLAKTKEEKK